MSKRIAGVEIAITGLVGKSQLARDEPHRDAHGAGRALLSSGEHELAAAMLALIGRIGRAALHCVNLSRR